MNNSIEDYYKQRLIEQSQENNREARRVAYHFLRKGVLHPAFEEKATNFCIAHNKSIREYMTQVLRVEYAAITFAKDPVKQNLRENCQLDYLTKIRGLNVKRLNQSGDYALRLFDGDIIEGKNYMDNRTRALDFVHANVDYTDYICAKYTNREGGSQDNSLKEVINFLIEANKYVSKNENTNIRFVALCDGSFYRGKFNCFNKYLNSNVIVTTSDTYMKD